MVYRYEDFAPGEVYHICTRSVEQRDIFVDNGDRGRFIELLTYCLPRVQGMSYSTAKRLNRKVEITDAGAGLVDVLCYCLMTNHIHLLIKENFESGTSQYLQRLLNSYARYFNIRHERTGTLFAGPFRAIGIDADEQLLHVSRYIHLNPYAAHMFNDPFTYSWSSLDEYSRLRSGNSICHTGLIRGMMRASEYRLFVADEADYSKGLADIKHLLLEDDA